MNNKGVHRLGKKFFTQNTNRVARALIGKNMVFDYGKRACRITETEAYRGFDDKACHASKGRTERNKVMFGPAGRLYIYLIYGIYYMLNIVTEEKDFPAAVLIRGLDPLKGIEADLSGPGKLTRELEITKDQNNLDVTKSKQMYIVDSGYIPKDILRKRRIGVEYADEWADKKWRYILSS